MRRFFLLVAAIIGSTAIAIAAGLHDMPGRVVTVPNAPITIQLCDLNNGNFGVVGLNRTTLALESFDVRFQTFDADGKIIGSATFTYPEKLASGDSDKQVQFNYGKMPSPVDNVSMTCRLNAATFAGKKPWHYGDTWKGKLLPIATPTPGAQQ